MKRDEPGLAEENIARLLRAAHREEAVAPAWLCEAALRGLSATAQRRPVAGAEFPAGVMCLLVGQLALLAAAVLAGGGLVGPGGRPELPVALTRLALGANVFGIPFAAGTIILLRRLAHVR